jgi:hypothetical protein
MLVEVCKWFVVENSAVFLQQEKGTGGQGRWEADFKKDEGTNDFQGNTVVI